MRYTFLWVLMLVSFTLNAQERTKKEIKQAWKHVPASIEECMTQLDIIVSDTSKKNWGSRPEDKANTNPFFGMNIRNNWKLWRGGKLSKYFNAYNIYHPEDISHIILTGYHRHLNNKSTNIDTLLAIHNAWLEAFRESERLSKYFKPGDTVTALNYYTNGIGNFLLERKTRYEIKGVIQEVLDSSEILKVHITGMTSALGRRKNQLAECKFEKERISCGAVVHTPYYLWLKSK